MILIGEWTSSSSSQVSDVFFSAPPELLPALSILLSECIPEALNARSNMGVQEVIVVSGPRMEIVRPQYWDSMTQHVLVPKLFFLTTTPSPPPLATTSFSISPLLFQLPSSSLSLCWKLMEIREINTNRSQANHRHKSNTTI